VRSRLRGGQDYRALALAGALALYALTLSPVAGAALDKLLDIGLDIGHLLDIGHRPNVIFTCPVAMMAQTTKRFVQS
jgi:hypothetical protein